MKEPNNNFEKQWREQFQDAKVAPGSSVWDRIDASLSGNQVAYYKKKLFYYKMVAAASILLALAIGTFSIYNFIQDPGPQLTEISLDQETSQPAQYTPGQQSISNSGISTLPGPEMDVKDALAQVIAVTNDSGGEIMSSTEQNEEYWMALGRAQEEESERSESFAFAGKDNSSGQTSRLESLFKVPYERPSRKYAIEKKINPYDQPYKLDMLALETYEEDGRDDPGKLWAGVNFTSGFFDPNISYGGHGQADMFSNVNPGTSGSVERIYGSNAEIQDQASSIMSYKPEESSYQSNISLSYGVDFGYRFSKRFVLISGVGYQQNHGSTSVKTYIEPASSNTKYANHAIVIEKAGPESGLNTYNELNSEVQLNSTFEFVTVPVNVGYYLIDKKIKWLMTAGMSTDIFIKNTIDDSQNMFDPINYKPGDESPYNPVYFNGKLGTMVHYTFSKNYQISLEPSYRIGISSFTKDNSAFSSRPSSFLISAGFSYLF